MNVFIVDSPLQYLNAEEAKHYFYLDTSKTSLIVFEGVSKKNLNQIKSIVNPEYWKNIHYLPFNQHKLFTKKI